MGFKHQHPNYKSYTSESFYLTDFPNDFNRSLEGFIIRLCNDEGNLLKHIINKIAAIIPMEVTDNYSWNYLLNDLKYYIRKLMENELYKIMDFLSELYEMSYYYITLDDFNDFLEEQSIGYSLNGNKTWDIREDVKITTENIDNTIVKVSDICEQTMLHLEQAKSHIIQNDNDRDRKDAVRDALSAMEALLKEITNANSVKEAIKLMRNIKIYGADFIVKEGLVLWDILQENYRDLRHGNPDISDLSYEECLYLVDRINCYINYICSIYKKQKSSFGGRSSAVVN